MRTSRAKLPWLYLVLAYGFAWVVWIPVALTGQDYQSSPLLLAAVLVGVFGPGLAGIILTYAEEGREGRRDFWRRMFDARRIRPRWWVLIVLLWPAMHILAIALTRLWGGNLPDFEFAHELASQPFSIPLVVALYFIQSGLEELGWRGYMLERVQPGWGPLKASLIVGVFHALWHLPLFWVAGTNQIEMGFGFDSLLFVAAAVSSSVYATSCYNGNGHSTLAATLLHTTGNLSLDALTDGPATLQFQLYALLMVAGALVIGAMWARRSKARAQTGAVVETLTAPADA